MPALSGSQVAQIVYQAGFRGQDLVHMTGIARRESGWTPDAHRTDRNPSDLSGDMGLFQINYVNWPTVSQALGLTHRSQLFDPLINARAAKVLFDASGYAPWTAGPGGWSAGGNPLHGVSVSTAQQAVNEAQSAGMLGQDWQGSGGGSSAQSGNPDAIGNVSGAQFEGGPVTLPADARVVHNSETGNTYAVFDLGGISISYDIGYNSAQYDPNSVEHVSDEAWRQMNAVDAGAVEEVATVTVSFGSYREFWDSIVGSVMGYNNPARHDAGVLRVLAEFAGRPDMTEAELQNRLQATDWFQTRTQTELEWNSISGAERDKRLAETEARMVETLFQFAGERVDSSDPRIANYAEQVASGKIGFGAYTEIVKQQATANPESPYARQTRDEEEAQRQRPVDLENTAQRVRETTERWGLNWSAETINKWARNIVEKTASDEDLVMTLRNEAQVLFPWKDPEVETATAAAPWLETYRRTMERSGTVNTNEVQRALVAGQTPWEFEQELKKSDAWLGTQNGQEAVIGIGAEMGRRMGFEN